MALSTIACRQGPIMKTAVDYTRGMCRKTVMLRTVWAKIESRRRLFLIDERCDFIEPVKFYLNHLAYDGRHGISLSSDGGSRNQKKMPRRSIAAFFIQLEGLLLISQT